MSRLSQFYFDDNVGDYRESQDFFSDLTGAFDVYDDGYKFYVRTGTLVLDLPDRVKSNTTIMEQYGYFTATQVAQHRQHFINGSGSTGVIGFEDGIVSANGWYIASCGGPLTTTQPSASAGSQSSLVMRSQDEFATWKFSDISPYVHQHVVLANGIPFIYASTAAIGTPSFCMQRTNVLKSHDGGATWVPVLPTSVWNYKTTQVGYFNNRYFAVTDHGIWYSEDANADTWQELQGPFTATSSQSDIAYLTQVSGFGYASPTYPTSIVWDGTRYIVSMYNGSTIGGGTGTANHAGIIYNTELSEFGWQRMTLNDSGNTVIRLIRANDKTFAISKGLGMQYVGTGTSFAQCANLYSYGTANIVHGLIWESANSRYWAATGNGLFQSSDGVSFVQATSTALNSCQSIALKGGVVYSCNFTGTVVRSTSATAAATTAQTGNAIANFISVANDKIFVFGSNTRGHSESTYTPGMEGCIRTTTDGTTFTNKMRIGRTKQFYVDTAANCLLILANTSVVKYNATTKEYSSYDLPVVANVILKTANNLYTIGSHHSPDLVTWTASSGATGLNPNVIAMAMSANGMIMASNTTATKYSVTNGTTWTAVTGPYCDFIEYGGGTFCGLSSVNSQNVQISTSGVAWQSGDFINTPAAAFRTITWEPFRKTWWLGGWFQTYLYGTFDHTNRAPDTLEVGTMNPNANCDAILTVKDFKDSYTSNTSGYVGVFAVDMNQARLVSLRAGASTSGIVNVANVGVIWTAIANDLVFIHTSQSLFGTPNVNYTSLHFGPPTGSLRANAYNTGTMQYAYNQAAPSIFKNNMLNSCVKFDNKYWLPPILGTTGWSELVKDSLYIPGDGTKFLRVY